MIINGMEVIVAKPFRSPKITLSHDVKVTDDFREELQNWLNRFFGFVESKAIKDDEAYIVNGRIICSPTVFDKLLKQWHQDVVYYGDNACLMWKISENSRWCQLQSNLPATIQSEPWRFRRKDSAEQPFDLERAKSGDIVEYFTEEKGWHRITGYVTKDIICDAYGHQCSHINKIVFSLIEIYGDDNVFMDNLRMKYPPKVNHE